MRFVIRLGAFSRFGAPCLVVALALLVTSAPAAAAPRVVTGQLSKAGYTVIAMAADGNARSVRARGRRFRLRPPASRVSLHLRRPDGVYAGPIVVATRKRGRRAVVGVRRGAQLGRVTIRSRRGYASARVARRWIDLQREARARRGVPIGAGKFGLVRSRLPRVRPPGDRDADGIADPLDIDANGNRVIDKYERGANASAVLARGGDRIATASARATLRGEVLGVTSGGSVRARVCGIDVTRTARWPSGSPTPVVGAIYEFEVDLADGQDVTVLSVRGPIGGDCAPAPPPAQIPRVGTGLMLPLKDTVNANASALTVADINATLAQRGLLFLQGPPLGSTTVELDCSPNPANPGGRTGGLIYCAPGGSGRVSPTPIPGAAPRSWPLAFPDCCDSDRDGFGELGPLERFEDPKGINAFYSHGATTAQIGTGDILNWRVTQAGQAREFPATLPDVFATVPALVSYRDGAGNSGTITYPVPPPYVGSRPDYLGPFEGPYHGFPVAPCPAGAPPPCEEGDVVLTLEFWRPQREAIPGAEQGQWIDIGGLVYAPGFSGPWSESDAQRSLPSLPACARDDLSTTNPGLTPEEVIGPFNRGYGFRDPAPARPANRANTLSFSVNVTDCLASTTTIPGIGGSWEPGENVSMWLRGELGGAADGSAGATQQLLFTMR